MQVVMLLAVLRST